MRMEARPHFGGGEEVAALRACLPLLISALMILALGRAGWPHRIKKVLEVTEGLMRCPFVNQKPATDKLTGQMRVIP